MSNVFQDQAYSDYILNLNEMGVTIPTPIQTSAIPTIGEGHDFVGVAPTGTGKTIAYLLPILSRIDLKLKKPQAIVLAPTHELASQIYKHARLLCSRNNKGEQTGESAKPLPALIIGGANIHRQIDQLKDKPHIIIGSSGRILELIKTKKLTVHYVKTIVVDEADRLLDKNNAPDVCAIINATLRDRQLVFLSASIDNKAMTKISEISKTPAIVNIKQDLNIEHLYFICPYREKVEFIRKIVHAEEIQKGIVFTKSQGDVDVTVKRLNYHGIKAVALSGEDFKTKRKQALQDFTDGKATLLVASDLAARGLDIPNVTHIFSIDVPENPLSYMHRAGRTGRMGKAGISIIIGTEQEEHFIKAYENKLKITLKKTKTAYGKLMKN